LPGQKVSEHSWRKSWQTPFEQGHEANPRLVEAMSREGQAPCLELSAGGSDAPHRSSGGLSPPAQETPRGVTQSSLAGLQQDSLGPGHGRETRPEIPARAQGGSASETSRGPRPLWQGGRQDGLLAPPKPNVPRARWHSGCLVPEAPRSQRVRLQRNHTLGTRPVVHSARGVPEKSRARSRRGYDCPVQSRPCPRAVGRCGPPRLTRALVRTGRLVHGRRARRTLRQAQ